MQKTDVIFRKFRDGDILAVFPALPGTNKWHLDCASYQHIGQHGACSVDIASMTKPALRHEYAALKKELEGVGYNLNIVARFTPAHVTARKLAVQRVG